MMIICRKYTFGHCQVLDVHFYTYLYLYLHFYSYLSNVHTNEQNGPCCQIARDILLPLSNHRSCSTDVQMCWCAHEIKKSKMPDSNIDHTNYKPHLSNPYLTFRKDIILHVSLLLKMCIASIIQTLGTLILQLLSPKETLTFLIFLGSFLNKKTSYQIKS